MKFNTKPIILMGSALLALASLSSGCADHTPDELVVVQAPVVDIDNDGVLDNLDNCDDVPNEDQADTDNNGVGDACQADDDSDGHLDGADNCPLVSNSDQHNHDGPGNLNSIVTTDTMGDACDPDDDNDGICDQDVPEGTVGCVYYDDHPDNCEGTPNPLQEDLDNDYFGDACDNDWDGDNVHNDDDTCPFLRNQGEGPQKDSDSDGDGDLCDDDDDGDGIPDVSDNCPLHCNPEQVNMDTSDGNTDTEGDIFGDECDTDPDGDGVMNFHMWQMPPWSCDDDDNCTVDLDCGDDDNCTDDWCYMPEDGNVTANYWTCQNTIDLENEGCMEPQCSTNTDCPSDGNPCTDEWCDMGVCAVLNNTASCADSDLCDGAEVCAGGVCTDQADLVCNDNNSCTDDTCVPATGCSYMSDDTNVCVDANLCNGTETCVSGVCTDQADLSCNDEDGTTADSCDPSTGCVHTPIGGACTVNANCNDGDPLTYDTCVSLVCQYAPGIRVQVSSTDVSEAWQVNFYYNGTTISGNLPFDGTLPKTQSCDWGVDLAVNRPSTNLYWDCNPGFPSKSTLTVMVNGVTKTNQFMQRASACGNAAPGNLYLSDETGDNDLGCPAAP